MSAHSCIVNCDRQMARSVKANSEQTGYCAWGETCPADLHSTQCRRSGTENDQRSYAKIMNPFTDVVATANTNTSEPIEEGRSVEGNVSRRDSLSNSVVAWGGATALLAASSAMAIEESSSKVLGAGNIPGDGVDHDSTKVATDLKSIVTTAPWGHPEAGRKIAGKKVWYHYVGGGTVEHDYVDEQHVIWRSLDKERKVKYSQRDRMYCFEIASEVYFITWNEPTANDSVKRNHYPGPWPVWVLGDFANLRATVAYPNPDEYGNSLFIVAQALLEIKE